MQSLRDSALPMKLDKDGQKTLAVILAQCFDTMKTFGKKPEQLKNAAALFSFALEDFTSEQVLSAFKWHLQHSTEMPTPADISNTIKRGNRPPLDKAVYTALIRKRERTTEKYSYGTYDDLTDQERQYVADYELFHIEGK